MRHTHCILYNYPHSVFEHANFQTLPETGSHYNDAVIIPTSEPKNRQFLYFGDVIFSDLGRWPIQTAFSPYLNSLIEHSAFVIYSAVLSALVKSQGSRQCFLFRCIHGLNHLVNYTCSYYKIPLMGFKHPKTS